MSTSRRQIPYITLEDAKSSETLQKYIYPNLDINYYWSDDFSPQIYIALARAGFISVTHQHEDQLLLLPEMQKEYAVLDFENLHVSSNVKKLLNKREYSLSFNTRFNDVIKLIQEAYDPCWIIGEYADLMKELSQATHDDFTLFSTELHDEKNGALVAGEIGYITKNIYTSLSGFHINEKSYNNWGTLQLVLLGRHLKEQGVGFWNLGHASMKYKTDLGAKIFKRADFLEKWREMD